jgi:hypothetical protein
VKAAKARRERSLELQASYGLALTLSRGGAAEETKAAVARAEELASEVNDPAARLAVYPIQFMASMLSGQVASADAIAEVYLREARNAGAALDIAKAGIMLGQARVNRGALANARAHVEEALYGLRWWERA